MRSKTFIESGLKKALKKLHLLQIIHYDIKLDNICYSYERDLYILIDFGLSKLIK
jgi:tRNA A-37 threonylcarbamoyl transferase component Bud32